MTAAPALFGRLGLVARHAERGLLVLGDDAEALKSIRPLLNLLSARDSRFHLLAASGVPETARGLRACLPMAEPVALPVEYTLAMGLFLRRLNVRAAVFVEDCRTTAARSLLRSLAEQAITIVSLSGRDARRIDLQAPATVASERVVATGGGAVAAPVEALSWEETGDLLAELMARDLKPLRQENAAHLAPARALVRWSRLPRGQEGPLAWRFRRYMSCDALAQRLGNPRNIMCLGNGPSSEAPALDGQAHDALFRVNHAWRERSRFNAPQVVFTGGGPTMRLLPKVVFGLQTSGAEVRLAAARALNPLASGCEFFNVHDLSDRLGAFNWGHLRPTNGASMLAAAVALRPSRLIVAGIDLFQHPDGSYPGDRTSLNAYSPGHSRETELEFMLGLLATYRGELVIVGDILRKAYDARMRGRGLEKSAPA